MPPATLPGSADSLNKFEDLSGVDIADYANPYDALIEVCHDDSGLIQSKYSNHRITRNAQQKAKLLASDSSGLILDTVLQRLVDPSIEPGFEDPRNCLVFWARPPAHIRSLVDDIQQQLRLLSPELWLMPLDNLHMTALEITHSLTSTEIHSIINAIGASTIGTMTDYTYTHRARLIKPMISYDGAAVALSFLPAAGELLPKTISTRHQNDPRHTPARASSEDNFTYHHLRRDLYNIAHTSGVSIDSRYVVPSSHITIGRFLTQASHNTPAKMQAWIAKIEEINAWLEEKFWPSDGRRRNPDGEWIVGQQKGLDCREGTLWYGGGHTVRLGKGF